MQDNKLRRTKKSTSKTGKKVNKRILKNKILNYLNKDKDWQYFRSVEAHRTYMYSLSLYKHLRFGNTKIGEVQDDNNPVFKDKEKI